MSENIFSTLGTRLGVHWGVPMLSPPSSTTGDDGRQRETPTGDSNGRQRKPIEKPTGDRKF
jgi:hypothetical protein